MGRESMKKLQKLVVDFRDKRDWKQFHNPKDMAISLVLEATELLELFQWKNDQEMKDFVKSAKFQDVREEVVDVLYWVLLISYDFNIDIEKEFRRKMKINEKKYPVEKAKGKHNKYTEL